MMYRRYKVIYTETNEAEFELDIPADVNPDDASTWVERHWNEVVKPRLEFTHLWLVDNGVEVVPMPRIPWFDRNNGEWVHDRPEPAGHRDLDDDEPWYGSPCPVQGSHTDGQGLSCNTCAICGGHMCEEHTARCVTCGFTVCDNDSRPEDECGEWECDECAGRAEETRRLLGILDDYEATESQKNVIRGFFHAIHE